MRLASFREGTRLALDQVRGNKGRSALTILGIVVGVAVVMAMSAMISGIRSAFMAAVMQGGAQNFVVMRYDPNAPRNPNQHGPPWGRNPPITAAEVERVSRLRGVQVAVANVPAEGQITYVGRHITDLRISGEGQGWMQLTGGRLLRGHSYLASDVEAARPVAVITPELARDLFGPVDPIGRRARINGQSFEVIGVYDPAAMPFEGSRDHTAYVPYTAAIKYLNAWADWMIIFVRPAEGVSQAEAIDQVTVALRTMHGLRPGEPNDFVLAKLEAFIARFNRITGIFFVVMIALSSVGLMVGGVGVIAIMMIAVTERTREIGIRKALGATQREILFQFLIEAITLTVVGAALGMAIGGIGAFAIAKFSPIPARVPLNAVLAALGMAAVAGVAFGLWPAWRAARMDPVEALRYE